MSNFQVGDKVRITGLDTKYGAYASSRSQGLFVGNTGTIAAMYGENVSVMTDNAAHPSDSSGDGWFLLSGCVELIAEVSA